MTGRWLELVLRASGQDGVTAAAAELEADAVALCADGVKGACSFAEWGSPFSPAAAHAALSPECDGGDPVSCLVSGWALGQEPWGTWSQQLPTAIDARLLVERACALDLPRGCVEVARALFHGVGSTARPNKARERLAPLCRAKEASACGLLGHVTADPSRKRDLLARASDLGFAPALRELALLPGSDAIVFHEAACLSGVGESCRDLASIDAARRRTALETGCRVQHKGSCTDLAVTRVAEGDREGGLAALDELCTESDVTEACARSELVRLDVVPRPHLSGTVLPVERELLAARFMDKMWRCYVDRLGRGEVSGPMSLFVQVSTEGSIEGASGVGPFADAPLQECLTTAARTVRSIAAPEGGAALVRYDLFLAHHAEVRFRFHHIASFSPSELATIVSPQEVAVIEDLADLGPAFERCALLDPAEAAPIAVDVVIKRNGRVVVRDVAESSEVVAIDACVSDVLRSADIDAAEFRVEGLVLVRFLQALQNGDPEDG